MYKRQTYANEREVKENTIASVNDLDDSNRYLASTENTFKLKKYRNTTTEEDLDASLSDAHKTYHNVSVLELSLIHISEPTRLELESRFTA